MGLGRRPGLWLLLAALPVIQSCAPVVVAGAAGVAVAANDGRSLGALVDDAGIEIRSRTALARDSTLRGTTDIGITSMNGLVLLTGEAESPALRDKVVSDVRDIAGVRRVINAVRVAPPASLADHSRDTWLTGRVKAQMLATRDLRSLQFKVVTADATVYLMGLVTRREGDEAAEIARSVPGVRLVVKLFEYTD